MTEIHGDDSDDAGFYNPAELIDIDHRTAWWMKDARFQPDTHDKVWTLNYPMLMDWARVNPPPTHDGLVASAAIGSSVKADRYTRMIQIKVTDRQWELFTHAAAMEGMGLSAWIRQLCLHASAGYAPKPSTRRYKPYRWKPPIAYTEGTLQSSAQHWRYLPNVTVPNIFYPGALSVVYDPNSRLFRNAYGQKLFDKITRAPYIPEGYDIDGNNLTGDSTPVTDIAIPSARNMFAAVIAQSEERERMRAMSKPVPGKSEWAGVIAERIAREQGPEELARIERERNARGKPSDDDGLI